ncbi:unnamed protein product [Chrysoparadoxa australica]
MGKRKETILSPEVQNAKKRFTSVLSLRALKHGSEAGSPRKGFTSATTGRSIGGASMPKLGTIGGIKKGKGAATRLKRSETQDEDEQCITHLLHKISEQSEIKRKKEAAKERKGLKGRAVSNLKRGMTRKSEDMRADIQAEAHQMLLTLEELRATAKRVLQDVEAAKAHHEEAEEKKRYVVNKALAHMRNRESQGIAAIAATFSDQHEQVSQHVAAECDSQLEEALAALESVEEYEPDYQDLQMKALLYQLMNQ